MRDEEGGGGEVMGRRGRVGGHTDCVSLLLECACGQG